MPPPAPPESPHDLIWFVSCVDGKPVTRLSLAGHGPRSLIGAERGEARALTYYPDQIVALTRAEVDAFGAIYQRTIDEGNLRRRTRDEWEAGRRAQKARQADELAKIKAAQVAAEKAVEEAARNGTAAPSGGAPS